MKSDDPTTVTTRVEITAAGHQVVIETTGCLSDVAQKALELWRATDDKALTKGYGTSVGFHTDIAVDRPVSYDFEPADARTG